MRKPYQVLVLPFTITDNKLYVYIFKRSNGNWWQFIAGGGEDEESIAETAIRELLEETGVQINSELIELQTVTSIPVSAFTNKGITYDENINIIPEYSFAVNISNQSIILSTEHNDYKLLPIDEAITLLRYDGNKTALYELSKLFDSGRLLHQKYDQVHPGTEWVFNNNVAQVFHNMLSRSIPELEMMRNLVTMYGERYVKPNSTILDLGCSCGDSLYPFIKKFGNANKYVGIDCSEPMLKQAELFYSEEVKNNIVSFQLMDLEKTFPDVEACLVLSVLTMQFLSEKHRIECLKKAYYALIPGGAIILVEKIKGETKEEDSVLTELYYKFKNIQGYSWQEIERKRMSLQNNLRPFTIKHNIELLYEVGFNKVYGFWRCLNFAAWIAIK